MTGDFLSLSYPTLRNGFIRPTFLEMIKMLGKLEKLLHEGKITEDEYKEKKTIYIETLLDLYIRDIITKEELYEKINK